MSDYLKSNIVLILSFLFIMANAVFIAMEMYWFSAIPFVLVLFLLAFIALDKLVWFIVFATPLSVNLEELAFGGIGMFLPTEPLMFGIMILFFIRLAIDKTFDHKIVRHPISVLIYTYLIWIGISTITSTMPIVSLKFLVAKLWFIVVFYFIVSQLFVRVRNIRLFFWLFVIPLTAVAIYTFIHHSLFGFEERPAHWVMQPFFKDHTVYGAVMSMIFPIVILLLVMKRYAHYRLITFCIMSIFILGIVFSYGRAAWLSLIFAFVIYLVYLFRIRFSVLFIVISGLAIALTLYWNNVINKLEQNTQDSTGTRLAEHVQSISNITTDASNLERINRWNSAIAMFEVKPFFGWGPGTYSFQYAPFQSPQDKTIISTNAGDMGNAHSEILGPLAEQGLLGPILYLLLLTFFFYKGSVLYKKLPAGELKEIVLFVLLAMSTYIINGSLNNFLDTDKASVPFWAFIAIIVSIDIHREEMLKEIEQSTT